MMNQILFYPQYKLTAFLFFAFYFTWEFLKRFLNRYLTLELFFMRIGKCCLLLLNAAMLPNEYCFLFPFMSPETTGTNKEIGKMKDSFV